MRPHRISIIGLAGAILALLACNFPLFAPVTRPTPQEQPSATPTTAPQATAIPSLTASPAATATTTVVPTPSTPQVSPNAVNVNCRTGPDTAYDAISVLMFGNSAQVAGRNDDSSWWYVRDPTNPGGFCWIAASVVTLSGPLGGIPVIAAPPIVTNVTVGVELPLSAFCGGPNAVMFSGKISTNGATKVRYQWEITGDKNNTTSPQTLNFTKAGTKDVPDPGAYSVDCGQYKVTLHVLNPNNVSASKRFKIEAP